MSDALSWSILITLGANLVAISVVATKINIKLDFMMEEIKSLKRQVEELRLRVGLVEQRLADLTDQVRGWRHDEDERLGAHKRRIEALEEAAKH